MPSFGDNFWLMFPLINVMNKLGGQDTVHLSHDRPDSVIFKHFSAKGRQEALDVLKKEYDLKYTTDLTGVQSCLDNYLSDRKKLLSDGLSKNKLAHEKLSPSTFSLLPPDAKKTAINDEIDKKKEASIEELYERIQNIKKELTDQLAADKTQIDTLFSNNSDLRKALKAAPIGEEVDPRAMNEDEINALKSELLTSLNEAYNKATDSLNQESDKQFKLAEDELNAVLWLADRYKYYPKDKEIIDQYMLKEAQNKAEGLPETGVASSITGGGTLQKLNTQVKDKLLIDGSEPVTGRPVKGFRTETGQFIQCDGKSCKTQFPARIPFGQGMRALAYVLGNTSLQGDSNRWATSSYYLSWQDNIKFDAKSMAGKLFAEGYREATICIDHNPKDPENKHALEVAQKFVEACCEEGFEIDKITVKINGHETPMFDQPNKEGKKDKDGNIIITKGVFKSKDALDAMVNIAKTKVQEREKVIAKTPQMTQMGNEYKARLKESVEADAAAKAAKKTAPDIPSAPSPNI